MLPSFDLGGKTGSLKLKWQWVGLNFFWNAYTLCFLKENPVYNFKYSFRKLISWWYKIVSSPGRNWEFLGSLFFGITDDYVALLQGYLIHF